MDIRTAFLADHARVHSAAVAPAEAVNMEDLVCRSLNDDQLLARPDGLNSVAWLIWHMARCEDVAINGVLRGCPQVLESGGWVSRIGVDARHIGTGDTEEEVEAFGQRVNVRALREYRAAVGRETRSWVEGLDPAILDATVEGGAVARGLGAFGARADWVERLWQGRTRGWFLFWLASGHHYVHLGEAMVTVGRLRGA